MHEEFKNFLVYGLRKAIEIGDLLKKQKSELSHGDWANWIQDNLTFGDRQARKYMQIYRSQDKLNRHCSSVLSIGRYIDAIKEIEADEKQQERQIRLERYKSTAGHYTEDEQIKVLHGEFQDICYGFDGNSIDHIITDPPYPGEYLPLLSDLSRTAERVLKPGGFCIAYAGQFYLPEEIKRLGEYLEYYWILVLIHTNRNDVFQRNIANLNRTVLIFQKPPMTRLNRFVTDTIDPYPREKDLHEWQQLPGEAKELLDRFTEEGDLILDPFGGSGTTAIACKENNRRCIIIEKEEENIKIIKSRLYQYTTVKQ